MVDLDRNALAAKHFQSTAKAWTDRYLPGHELSTNFLVRHIAVEWHLNRIAPERSFKRALDLGCGTGPYLPLLACFAKEVVGIDIAPAMLEEARKKLPDEAMNITLVQGSVMQIPFRDNYFDIGVCVGVLEYLDNPIEVLRESFRVMKPGGQIVFTLPHCVSVAYITGLPRTISLMIPPNWKIAIGSFANRLQGRAPDPSKYYLGACFTRNKIRHLCQEASLKITQLTCSGYHGLRFVGIPLPSGLGGIFERFAENRRHRFPWKYFGNNIIVTIRKSTSKNKDNHSLMWG